MALQLSGTISMDDIAREMGFPASTITELRLQSPSGTKQVWIQGAWRNLNMCSPYLPTHTAPFDVDHWYGYNHNAVGVTSVVVSGTTTVSNGVQYTYTANLNGSNFTGATYQWEKYENGSWSNLGTSSTQNITWSNATGAKVKVTVSGICGGGSVTNTQDINLACTAPSAVSISGDTGTGGTGQRTYTLNSFAGTNQNVTYTWTVGSYATITSGQGTNSIVVTFSFNNPYASLSTTVKCNVTNECGNADSNIITVSPYIYQNATETRYWTKNNCADGGVGSSVGYTLNSGVKKDYNAFDLQTQIEDYFNSGGQSNANTNGTCTWYNDYVEASATPNNCAAHYCASQGIYAVDANSYSSTTSKSAANNLAIDYVYNNKQAWANAYYSSANNSTIAPARVVQQAYCYQCEFGNVAKSASATKICTCGNQTANYTVPANTIYRSSQQQADDEAQTLANNTAQTNADNMSCPTIYGNTYRQADFTRNNCGVGCTGSTITHSKAANTYWSCIDVASANTLADNDLYSEGQGIANSTGTCNCNIPAPTDMRLNNWDFAGNKTQALLAFTDNSVDETGFEVWYSGDGSNYSLLYTLTANTTTFTINYNDFASNSYYYFKARAVRNGLYSSFSNTLTFLTIPRRIDNISSSVTGNIQQSFLLWQEDSSNGSGINYQFYGIKLNSPCRSSSSYINTGSQSSSSGSNTRLITGLNPIGVNEFSPGYRFFIRSSNSTGYIDSVYFYVYSTQSSGIDTSSWDPSACSYWSN